jgi:hypothetical protein
MIYYDYAVIKLNTLFDSLAKIGLVKRFDATIRLWINTSAVAVNVSNPTTALDLSYNNDMLLIICRLVVFIILKLLLNLKKL